MKTAFIILIFLISSFSSLSSTPLNALTLTGVWQAEIEIEGEIRKEVIQFHERNDGSAFGYRLGGTEYQTVLNAQRVADTVSITLQAVDPVQTSEVTFKGTLADDTITGSVALGNLILPVTFARQNETFTERSFLMADFSEGDPDHMTSMSLLFDQSDTLITGNITGIDDCNLFSCGGSVTSLVETDLTLALTITSQGNCGSIADVALDFDPIEKRYSGTYEGTNCEGNFSGNMIAIRTNKAQSIDIADIFSILAKIADDLQEDQMFAEPFPEISDDYLYDSLNKAQLLTQLNDENAEFSNKQIVFHSFRKASTIIDPLSYSSMVSLFGLDFNDRRKGIKQGEIISQIYRETDTTQLDFAELRFFEKEADEWVLKGNGINMELPFASYTLEDDHVLINTDGGPIFLSLGPWGAHVGPHTGHMEGNAKADWMGLFARRDFQMTDLTSLGDSCVTDKKRGVPESEILAKVLNYASVTDNFEIHTVNLERLHEPDEYFGSTQEWNIEGRIKHYRFTFAHVQKIGEDLRAKMINAGYVDPWTVNAVSENLITADPVILSKNEKIGIPQLSAQEIPGCPGFVGGKHGIDQVPRYQVEFFTFNALSNHSESFYNWLPDELESSMAAIMNAQAADPLDYRYSNEVLKDWLWKAEMSLSNQDFIDRNDYSSIHGSLGGWFEYKDDSCNLSPDEDLLCDQLVSIFPISKDTQFYDPSLYHSRAVSYLVGHKNTEHFYKFGEVINKSMIDSISDQLIIRWRDHENLITGFQSISYQLFEDQKILKIHWGPILDDENAVVPENVPDEFTICDGQHVSCHSHEFNPKISG